MLLVLGDLLCGFIGFGDCFMGFYRDFRVAFLVFFCLNWRYHSGPLEEYVFIFRLLKQIS